jgi:hypothetical protein
MMLSIASVCLGMKLKPSIMAVYESGLETLMVTNVFLVTVTMVVTVLPFTVELLEGS